MGAIKNNKLVKMWSNLPLSARTSVAIMVASFFQSGMKLLFTPVFTRILTTSEYGVVSVFESMQTTLATITLLSLNASVYSRGMQEFKEDRDMYTSSLLFLSNICTVVVGTLFVIFNKQVVNILKLDGIYLVIMFIVFMFMPAYNFWIARQRFEYRYRGMLLVTVLVNIFSPIMSVVVILNCNTDKSLGKILGAEIVLMVAYLILYFRTWSKSHWKINWSYVKYGLKFNIPLVPHYASQQILSSCDRIMIKAMIDSSSAGIYGLSYQVASVVRIIWTSINTVLVPWEYDKIEQGKVEDIKSMTRLLIIAYGVLCIAIMFVAPEAVRLFAPATYYEGIYVIAPVIAGVFFTGVYSLLAILEFYYKKTVYVMVASTIAAVANVILNWIFIPMFGYQAAAYTTLVCYAIYALLHAFNLKRLHIAHFYDLKAIFILSLVMIVVCLVVAQTYDGFIIRYLLLAGTLVVAFIKRKIIINALLTLKKKDKTIDS